MLRGKGQDEYTTITACRYLERVFGYRKFILRGDQEPAMEQLKTMIKKHCRADIQVEGTPIGESQSAGEIESSIKGVQGMTRTYKLAMESRIGGEIGEDHPIMPFLVMQASAHWNRYHIGKDGMTSYRRLKGRNFRT